MYMVMRIIISIILYYKQYTKILNTQNCVYALIVKSNIPEKIGECST